VHVESGKRSRGLNVFMFDRGFAFLPANPYQNVKTRLYSLCRV
jgi:hypothetical protein